MNTSKFLMVLLAFSATHCSKSAESTSSGNPGGANAGDTSAVVAASGVDYPKIYCENVVKLKLRSDIKQELTFFCANGKPTKDFLDLQKDALAQAPGGYKLQLLQAQHDPENDRSEFLMAWAFRVPIRPFEVKARPLYDYVAQSFATETINVQSSAARRTDALDSDLHLWSADMSYDITIKGTQGLNLTSQRKSQYNLYQVQPGNEELGFGVEHLSEVDNPSYSRSVMLNVSFNDGLGYNDGKGGAVVITVLHFVLSNQGFPATATKSIQEIAQHAADSMYNGLKK